MSHIEEHCFNPDTKIWYGPVIEEPEDFQLTIGEVIRESLQRNPEKISQISANSGVSLTNEQILLRSLKIACYLTNNFDFHQDDIVTVIARNTENLAPLVFGLFNCGVSVNTLDTSFDEDEIVNILGYVKPKVVFSDADKYSVMSRVLRSLDYAVPIYIVSENTDEKPGTSVQEILNQVSAKDAHEFRPINPKDPRNHSAIIVCSSGTTGTAKGVCIPHTYLLPNEKMRTFGHFEPTLCFSSLYWMSGWYNLLRGTMGGMTRIITDEPFSPELMLRLIEQYKVQMMASPPSQMALMLKCPDLEKRDLSSLKIYICAGSAVHPTMCENLRNKLPNTMIMIAYGSTELIEVSSTAYNTTKAGSVGKSRPNLQLKILDDDDSQLGPNERGEICVKSPYKFLRYHGRPEDTARILDSDGWIHTGDVGYMDDDGYLYIVDRKKEIMKYKNYHVSPSELEGVLCELPDILQACVCGIPDTVYTDLPIALIVRRKNSNLSEEDVHRFMKSRLSDHKQLRGGVYFVDSLPMTPSGKICRPKAKKLALELESRV